jgi:hypothetical protein
MIHSGGNLGMSKCNRNYIIYLKKQNREPTSLICDDTDNLWLSRSDMEKGTSKQ